MKRKLQPSTAARTVLHVPRDLRATVRNFYLMISLLIAKCAVIYLFISILVSYSTYSHLRSQHVKIRFVVYALVTSLTPNHARKAKPVILKTFWSRMGLGNQRNLVSMEWVNIGYLAPAQISRIERSWLKPCVMCFGEKIQHSQQLSTRSLNSYRWTVREIWQTTWGCPTRRRRSEALSTCAIIPQIPE